MSSDFHQLHKNEAHKAHGITLCEYVTAFLSSSRNVEDTSSTNLYFFKKKNLMLQHYLREGPWAHNVAVLCNITKHAGNDKMVQ